MILISREAPRMNYPKNILISNQVSLYISVHQLAKLLKWEKLFIMNGRINEKWTGMSWQISFQADTEK